MQRFIHCPETQLCSQQAGTMWPDIRSTYRKFSELSWCQRYKAAPACTVLEQNVQKSQDTWFLVFRLTVIAQKARRNCRCSEVCYYRGEGLHHTHEEMLEDLGLLLPEILIADYPESHCAPEELTSRGQGWVQRAAATGVRSPKSIRKRFLQAGNVFPRCDQWEPCTG